MVDDHGDPKRAQIRKVGADRDGARAFVKSAEWTGCKSRDPDWEEHTLVKPFEGTGQQLPPDALPPARGPDVERIDFSRASVLRSSGAAPFDKAQDRLLPRGHRAEPSGPPGRGAQVPGPSPLVRF